MINNARDAYAFDRLPKKEKSGLFNVAIVRMGLSTSLALV